MKDILGAAIFDFYWGLLLLCTYNFYLMQRLRYDAGHPFSSVSCLHSFVSAILSVLIFLV